MVKDDHLSYSTMNQAACAARFLFESVLGKGRSVFQIPMAKVPAKQPELLAREEIARLFASCESPLHRILLQTVYATGLRVSEVCALRVKDIDSAPDRMCVRVECDKGGKTRYTLLSPTLLALLRQYAQAYHPRDWLFGSHGGTKSLYNVPAPESVWMGGIGCECQIFHCGKLNVRLLIDQPDTFLRWRDYLQRRVQNSPL